MPAVELQQRLLADLQQFAVPRHARWDPLGLMGVPESLREGTRRRGCVVSRLLVRTVRRGGKSDGHERSTRELATHQPGAAMMDAWLPHLLQPWTSCAG